MKIDGGDNELAWANILDYVVLTKQDKNVTRAAFILYLLERYNSGREQQQYRQKYGRPEK